MPLEIGGTSTTAKSPVPDENAVIGSSSIPSFARKQPLSGNELDAMAEGFSRMGDELLKLCSESVEARKNFVDKPENASLLKVLSRHPRFSEAMKNAGVLDSVGFAIMSELSHELSRTCAFTPELMSTWLATDPSPGYPNRDESPLLMSSPLIQGLKRPVDTVINPLPTPDAERQQSVHPQLRIQPPPSWSQRKPDTSMAGQTRDFMIGGVSERKLIIQFIQRNWPTAAAKPADILSRALTPLDIGASPEQREVLLNGMRRFDANMSSKDFKSEFKNFAKGNVFSAATCDAIERARREYIKKGGVLADLTYEQLLKHISDDDMSGFLAFLNKGPEYVRYRVTADDIKTGYVQQTGASAAHEMTTDALPHVPLSPERPVDDSRSVKRFRPTQNDNDDERTSGSPPLLPPLDHESAFSVASPAPIDLLRSAPLQESETAAFNGSFVRPAPTDDLSSISSPLRIVLDNSIPEEYLQDYSQVSMDWGNAALDSTPAEFFDVGRKYKLPIGVQRAPVTQVDMPTTPLADVPPSDMPVITIKNANDALQSLWVPPIAMSEQAINPLLQPAPEQT